MRVVLILPKELEAYVDPTTIQKRVRELIIAPLLEEVKQAKIAKLLEVERPRIKNELQLVSEKVSINITGVTPAPNETFNAEYTPPQGATNDVVINSKDI